MNTSGGTTRPTIACARGCRVLGRHQHDHAPGTGCPGCLPREARPDSTVCTRCLTLLHDALNQLAILWPDVAGGAARPLRSSTGGATSGPVQTSGHSEAGDAWRPRVTQVGNEIRDWLAYATRLLRHPDTDHRGALALRHIVAALDGVPVDVQLAALARHADRALADHPLGAAHVDDVLRLRTNTLGALQTGFVRRVPLAAQCLAEETHILDDGTTIERRCTGDLVAVLQDPDAGRSSTILCTRWPAAHRVPKSEWARLSDDLEAIR